MHCHLDLAPWNQVFTMIQLFKSFTYFILVEVGRLRRRQSIVEIFHTLRCRLYCWNHTWLMLKRIFPFSKECTIHQLAKLYSLLAARKYEVIRRSLSLRLAFHLLSPELSAGSLGRYWMKAVWSGLSESGCVTGLLLPVQFDEVSRKVLECSLLSHRHDGGEGV